MKHVITCTPGLFKLAVQGTPSSQLLWKSQGAEFFRD